MLRSGGVVPVELLLEVRELVQYLLEPELVDLMDDDEEHLVMLGPARKRALQRQKLFELEVFGVGRHTGSVFGDYFSRGE